MQRYNRRGTPSLVLIDRRGQVRHSAFGREPDLAVGARIAMLLAEKDPVLTDAGADVDQRACSIAGECD